MPRPALHLHQCPTTICSPVAGATPTGRACAPLSFGLRGMAAYSYHARVLGYTDGEIDLFFCTALRAIAQERDKDALFQLVEDTGRMAYRVMAELDKANTGAFGDPEPVEVPLTIEKGAFHRHLRPRPLRRQVPVGADRGQGHQCLHPLRDAACPRLPGAEKALLI